MLRKDMSLQEIVHHLRQMTSDVRRPTIRDAVVGRTLDIITISKLPEPFKTEALRAFVGHPPWNWNPAGINIFLKPSGDAIKFPPKENILHDSLPDYQRPDGQVAKNRLFDRPISIDASHAVLIVDLYGEKVETMEQREYLEWLQEQEDKAKPKAKSKAKAKAEKAAATRAKNKAEKEAAEKESGEEEQKDK